MIRNVTDALSTLRTGRWLACLVFLVSLAAVPQSVSGQEALLDAFGIEGPLRVSGSVGFEGGLYGVDGIPSRRRAATGRIFGQAVASAYGLTYGLNMLLSNERTRLQQSLNRVDLSLRYRWFYADAGTISPTLPAYTVGGISLGGGVMELTPGRWTVTLTGGQVQRRAQRVRQGSGGLLETPDRWLAAGRVGYGEAGGTHVHVVGTVVRDAVPAGADAELLRSEANVTLSPVGSVVLLGGDLRLEGELTVSALTGDRTAEAMDERAGLLFMPGLLESRVGSRTDYAGRFDAHLRRGSARVQLGYERIQPGFESLGLAHLRSDQERLRLRTRFRLFQDRLQLGVTFGQRRNNLLGDLQTTLRRRQIGLTASTRLFGTLAVTAVYNRLGNLTQPEVEAPDLYERRQISQTVSLSLANTFIRDEVTHTLALTSGYQTLGHSSDQPLPEGVKRAGFDNVNASLNYTASLPGGLSLNASGSALRSDTPTTDLTVWSLRSGAGHRFFERRLSVNVTAGWSSTRTTFAEAFDRSASEGTQLTLGSTAAYQFGVGALSFNLRGLSSERTGATSFREVQSTLRYVYRF